MEIREIRISKKLLIAAGLAAVGVALRLLPLSDNFAPIGAIALFAGAILGLRYALWLPVSIMVVSDLIIGMHPTVLFTWSGFLLVALFGTLLHGIRNRWRIPLGAAGSAVIFYLVSNFGVWLQGWLYPHTVQGLVDAYVMALPFLRTSFLADLSFAAIFFGAYALLSHRLTGSVSLRLRPNAPPIRYNARMNKPEVLQGAILFLKNF
jgi:hypothetical protein